MKSDMFKPRRISKRLLSIKKKLEESMIIDHIKKTLVVNKDLHYIECLILERFYQGYIVNVEGGVWLDNNNLILLPKILFRKVVSFSCSKNNLTSLKYSPEEVTATFWCDNNLLTSLEHCSKNVGKNFYCNSNPGRFTKDNVKEICTVKDEIIIF